MSERLYRCRFCEGAQFVDESPFEDVLVFCRCGHAMLPVSPSERDEYERVLSQQWEETRRV